MLLLGIISSFLLGSIPTAFLIGKIIRGIDIRSYGSGNVGATNAFRVVGPFWGVVVLFIDILKGVVSVTILADVFLTHIHSPHILLRIILGIICVCGHNWSLFMRFKGGKGVATTLGVLIGIGSVVSDIRFILLCVILVWFVVFLIFRIVSLSSIISAVSFPVFMITFHQSIGLIIISIILSFFIIIRHKKNIIGLINRTEQPLSFKGKGRIKKNKKAE